nr:rhombosortase [Cupriavidus sp. AU9028]
MLSAAFTFVPWLHAHGLYLRDAVLGEDGHQWWRVVTAMWVHLNWPHWLGNLLAAAGLLLIAVARAGVRTRQALLVLLACGAIAQLALLWVPSVRWYGGLSGALHGFALWCGLRLLAAPGVARALGVALAAAVLVKVWLEQSWLAPIVMDPMRGFGVVRAAHAAGAVAGLALWLLGEWWQRRRQREG